MPALGLMGRLRGGEAGQSPAVLGKLSFVKQDDGVTVMDRCPSHLSSLLLALTLALLRLPTSFSKEQTMTFQLLHTCIFAH